MALLDFFRGPRARTTTPVKLGIEVTVSGSLRSPTAIYKLVSGDLDIELNGRIVAPNGDVNLTTVLAAEGKGPATELTFSLVGTVTCEDGTEHGIEFRRPANRAFNLRHANGWCVWNGQFQASFPDPQRPTQLAVLDRNDDGRTYRYCLQIIAPGCPGHGKLDPSIINR